MTETIDQGDDLNIRLRQQAAIAEFGKQALRTHDLDALLQQASRLAADGLGIAKAKVLELLPDGRGLLVRAGVGWGPDVVGKAIIADIRSPAGYALRTGEPVISEDLSGESRFEIPPVLREHDIRSAINVLIQREGPAFGVLEVDSQRVHCFTRADADFLQNCANLIAAAIDRLDAEAKLKQAAEEKELLIHELQHRVKNSLQEIAALVHAQRRTVTDPAARRPLEVLGSRLEALSVIYRQLYLADHHPQVNLGAYLAELFDELFAFHGVDPQAITRTTCFCEIRLSLDSALPLGLIVCEFIVNSLKYAFPEGRGTISAGLKVIDDGRARLSLSDNGIGLPATAKDSAGLGLNLIRGLVDQIHGELDVTGRGGVQMTIHFPIQRPLRPRL